jgi:chromosome segregation ATPase
MTHDSDKITTHKEEFKQQFMNSHNVLSEKGVKHIANKLSGYISYLNREKDPTQFAQPIMIHVPILMRSVENEDLRDALYLQSKISTVSKEAEALIESLKTKIKTMKNDYKQQKQQYKDTKATLSKEEASAFNDALNSLLQNIKDLEEELHTTKSDSQAEKDKIKELKEKMKVIKNSLIQEYILYTNCKHLHYKNNKTQKVNTNTIK